MGNAKLPAIMKATAAYPMATRAWMPSAVLLRAGESEIVLPVSPEHAVAEHDLAGRQSRTLGAGWNRERPHRHVLQPLP
jgi:hypothetical protein